MADNGVEDPEGAIAKYFANIFKDYVEALNNYDSKQSTFGDFARSNLASTGLYAAANKAGINDSVLEKALNKYVEGVELTDEQKTKAYEQYAAERGYEYDAQLGRFTDPNNNNKKVDVNTADIDESQR